MMFEGQDCNALQTLVTNDTVFPNVQKCPIHVLNIFKITIKEERTLLALQGQISSDVRQNQKKLATLSDRIIELVSYCKLFHGQTKNNHKNNAFTTCCEI